MALYEDPHTISLNEREKSKTLDKGKVKFDGKSNLSEFPITKLGFHRITRSMKSSTSKAPLHAQYLSVIEILSEEGDYGSVDVSSQECEDKMDDPVVSLNDDFNENQFPVLQNDREIKIWSAVNNDSSSEKTLRSTMNTIKLKEQIEKLKGKLKRSESNSIVLKDEVQNLRSELLT